jgi:hypothetical protein
MFENFNQPTITNAKALLEHSNAQERLKAEQEAFKAKEKAEKEAFRSLQINQNAEANKIAKASLVLSIIAVIISIIIGIGSIYVTISR